MVGNQSPFIEQNNGRILSQKKLIYHFKYIELLIRVRLLACKLL